MTNLIANNASKFFVAVLALTMCVVLAGCGGSSQASSGSSSASASSASASASSASASSASASASASSASASAASAQAAGGLAFGQKTATALAVPFTNATGADITALSAVPVAGGAPVALMQAGETWAPNAQAMLYVEPGADGRYNLTFTNGGVARELHNIDFTRVTDVSIRLEGDVAYIGATVAGSLVSTLQEESDIAHSSATVGGPVTPQGAGAAQQGAAPAQQGAADAQQNAPAAQGEEVAVQGDDTTEEVVEYQEETVEYYEEPAAEGGEAAEAPAQSEDGCVTDVVLN